jgi:hypothetical protein
MSATLRTVSGMSNLSAAGSTATDTSTGSYRFHVLWREIHRT